MDKYMLKYCILLMHSFGGIDLYETMEGWESN